MDMKKDDRTNSPRSKVHYTPGNKTVTRPKTSIPSRRRSSVKNRNNNNSKKSDVAAEELMPGETEKDALSSASRLSVHISTGEAEGEGETPREGGDVEQTPRSQDVMVGTPREGKEEETPRSQDFVQGDPVDGRLEAGETETAPSAVAEQENGAGEERGKTNEMGVCEGREEGGDVPKDEQDPDPSHAGDDSANGGGVENELGGEGEENLLVEEIGELDLKGGTQQASQNQDVVEVNAEAEMVKASSQKDVSAESGDVERTDTIGDHAAVNEISSADHAKSPAEVDNNLSSLDAT